MLLKRTLSIGLSLAGTATAVALVPRSICHADYCLRALRASQIPTRLPQASVDCSRFLSGIGAGGEEQHATSTITSSTTVTSITTITLPTTITDSLTTTTTTTAATETSTVTIPLPGPETQKKKRQIVVTIPSYASLCSGPVRYTSACACIGVTSVPAAVETCSQTTTVSTTITISTTETVYTTATETSTLAATTTATPEEVIKSVYTFKIRSFDGTNTAYLRSAGAGLVRIVDDIADATYFSLDTTSGPLMSGVRKALVLGDGSEITYINMDEGDAGGQYQPIECSLGQENKLECEFFGSRYFGATDNFLVFGPEEGEAEVDLVLTAFAG
ncbi:uncharacterized protein DFL_001376 [Arthrobotrys flagrans]|uniref:Uncharacterized protein n=1 Tax=Arthrobotrys flagrans TaxID=97331 RepID=A0A437AH16_ARTFL|nr:hypothetical protein DFL_001376 [Arthrobotrys flagrans]